MRPDDFSLDNCLKCSICNTACPMLGAYPQYPGPKALGPELERLRREGIPTDSDWLEYCLGCHRCDMACPHQVGVSEMIAHAKARHHKPFIRAMRDWWFARPGLIGKLSTILPALSNFGLAMKPARLAMSIFMRITPLRSFPKYKWAKAQKPAHASGKRPRVLLFPGCSIRYNEPELGRKVIELLELNGFAAEVAATECCGVPATANGDAAVAQSLARANVKLLAGQVDAGVRIVTACSSCGHRIKTAFGGVLDEDKSLGSAAHKIAQNTYDLAELLMEQSDAGKLNTAFQAYEPAPGISRAMPPKVARHRTPLVSTCCGRFPEWQSKTSMPVAAASRVHLASSRRNTRLRWPLVSSCSAASARLSLNS